VVLGVVVAFSTQIAHLRRKIVLVKKLFVFLSLIEFFDGCQ